MAINIDIFKSVFQALSRKQPSFAKGLPFFAASPEATSGFYDRRALGMRDISDQALRQAMPESEDAQKMFAACLDVVGEILLLEKPHSFMAGVVTNVARAQITMSDPNQPPLFPGYDTAAYIIARAAFLQIAPGLAQHEWPSPHVMTSAENLERASIKSLAHHLLYQRLEKNRDMLSVLMTESRDLNALAWFLSRQIKDEPTLEEMRFYIEISLPGLTDERLSRLIDEKLKGLEVHYAILKDLYAQKKALQKRQTKIKSQTKKRKNQAQLTQITNSISNHKQFIETRKQHILSSREIFRGEAEGLAIDSLLKNATKAGSTAPSLKPPNKEKLSHAGKLIKNNTAKTVLEGLYKTYAAELASVNRAARLLSQQLRAAFNISIHRDLEEGAQLDPAALPRLIIDPAFQTPHMDIRENYGESLDTAVTILVDNSGSMGGNGKIQLAYLASEKLGFWLASAGLAVEILGYTTANRGMPHHIVYKERHEPHSKKVTEKMAAMLNNGLRVGNADGYAVDWAHKRLITAANKRKILIVVSDGVPADKGWQTSITAEDLLKSTISHIEENSSCEIVGIGIAHDVSPYYSNSILIENAADLPTAMCTALRQIIDPPAKSRARSLRRPRAPQRAPG